MPAAHKVLEQHYHLVSVLRSLCDKRRYLQGIRNDPAKQGFVENIDRKIETHTASIERVQSELAAQRAIVDNLFTSKRGE